MANNDRGQRLISKYVWVIETIYRRKRISFKELNERWVDDIDISRGVDIPKRTFDNWRYAIQDMFGIIISNENRGEYRYYIENEEDISKNGLRSWLYNTFCVSNALANSQSIKDRILLEYVPSGQEYLQIIIDAMKENKVLNITHYNYWKDQEYNFDVQPYCVKLFRQRWYLVGLSTYTYFREQGPRIYSLDRLRHVQVKDETFVMPKDWDAKEYFAGCYGIIAGLKKDIEPIKLKVSAARPTILETSLCTSRRRRLNAMVNTAYSRIRCATLQTSYRNCYGMAVMLRYWNLKPCVRTWQIWLNGCGTNTRMTRNERFCSYRF